MSPCINPFNYVFASVYKCICLHVQACKPYTLHLIYTVCIYVCLIAHVLHLVCMRVWVCVFFDCIFLTFDTHTSHTPHIPHHTHTHTHTQQEAVWTLSNIVAGNTFQVQVRSCFHSIPSSVKLPVPNSASINFCVLTYQVLYVCIHVKQYATYKYMYILHSTYTVAGYFRGVYISRVSKLLRFTAIHGINTKPHPRTQRSDFAGAIFFVEVFISRNSQNIYTPLENNSLYGILRV